MPVGLSSASRGFERLLLFTGLLLVFIYIGSRVYRSLYSRTAVHEYMQNHAAGSVEKAAVPLKPVSAIPDFRLWSQKRIKAYQTSLAGDFAPPLGVLKISLLDIEVPILEGTDDLTLDRAVGHIEGTAAPGQDGNVGIAGHRDGFFRPLKDIHVGDTMDLYSEKGNRRYVVDEILIVSPEDVSVLKPRNTPTLTLVTCYPFYFVGSAPSRYIVHASLQDARAERPE